MPFDAEAFFGGKKHTRNNLRNTPDMDNYMGMNSGFDFGRGSYYNDDMNNNGFVDAIDFAHPPKASGKRTKQARLLGTDENNVAFGLQKFGNAIGRSESDIGRVNRTRRKNQKRRLEAGVELAKRNPKKYSYQKAAERLESFEETDLRRKAGVHGTRLTPQGSYSNVKSNVRGIAGDIKNEIGYRVSKHKMSKKANQLRQQSERRLEDPEEKRAHQERLAKMYEQVPRHKEESPEDRDRHRALQKNLSNESRDELR